MAPLAALRARAGNEVVFVASMTGPSSFVESGTGVRYPGIPMHSLVYVANDAVCADSGRSLFVSSEWTFDVRRAEWNGSAANWLPFYQANAMCFGLGMDGARKRLWVLAGIGSAVVGF